MIRLISSKVTDADPPLLPFNLSLKDKRRAWNHIENGNYGSNLVTHTNASPKCNLIELKGGKIEHQSYKTKVPEYIR